MGCVQQKNENTIKANKMKEANEVKNLQPSVKEIKIVPTKTDIKQEDEKHNMKQTKNIIEHDFVKKGNGQEQNVTSQINNDKLDNSVKNSLTNINEIVFRSRTGTSRKNSILRKLSDKIKSKFSSRQNFKNVKTTQYIEFDVTNIYERMYPIWLDKENTYTFIISKSDPKITKKTDLNSTINDLDVYSYDNFPSKHLIGRVLGGSYFDITENESYTSKESGPLFLFINYNQQLQLLHNNITTYRVSIQAESLSTNDIEKKLDWDVLQLVNETSINEMSKRKVLNSIKINSLDTSNCYYQKHQALCSEFLLILNKIRSNPKKFAEQYLYQFLLNNNNDAEKKNYDFLINCLECPLLVYNKNGETRLEEISMEINNLLEFSDDLKETVLINEMNRINVNKDKLFICLLFTTETDTLALFLKFLTRSRFAEENLLLKSILNKNFTIFSISKRIFKDTTCLVSFKLKNA